MPIFDNNLTYKNNSHKKSVEEIQYIIWLYGIKKYPINKIRILTIRSTWFIKKQLHLHGLALDLKPVKYVKKKFIPLKQRMEKRNNKVKTYKDYLKEARQKEPITYS